MDLYEVWVTHRSDYFPLLLSTYSLYLAANTDFQSNVEISVMVTHWFAIHMSMSFSFEKEQRSMYCIGLTYHVGKGAAIRGIV